MKFRTTRKAIVNGSANLIQADYCELANLLQGHNPLAYTCGVYGWNFDVYEIDGVTICTGYRGMPGRRAAHAQEYDNRARAIWDDRSAPWEKRREAVEELLHEFIAQA